MVLLKNWPFFHLFFFKQYRPGKYVLWYSRTINVFLGNKNKKYIKSKSWHFPKGLTHGFAQKLAIFPSFFLGSIPQENVFYDILERKDAFLSYKKRTLKKSKNWHFCKGVNPWFCSKIDHFSIVLLRQYRPGKCVLWYFRTKKRLFRLWKQEV